ncbi:MAG: 4'-phosphopantetheinyl transferase superfamily protein [Bacteroidetes bacterium]|nr:4'-phosphopantetheinyl transferase superfamily protein [Bacteroidota bacterium]
MSLLKIEPINESTQLGIWKIEEPADELRSRACLTPEEADLFMTFKNETRRKQWLAYRILLNEMLPGDHPVLVYDEFGKPALRERDLFLSISHSGEFAAVIISRTHPVGVDIERIADRIERIKSRFLAPEEEQQIGEANRLEKLYVAWGAKESLYKIYGRPEVEFQRDIFIEPFDYLCKGNGRCCGRMKTPEGEESYTVFYERIAGYMLVYAMKQGQ